MKGHLGGNLVTFLVYYAPNMNQVSFFHSLLRSLALEFEGDVILAGDSNLALDHILDKSHLSQLQSLLNKAENLLSCYITMTLLMLGGKPTLPLKTIPTFLKLIIIIHVSIMYFSSRGYYQN